MQEVEKLKTSTPITEKKKIEKEKATNEEIDSATPKNELKKTGAIQKKFDEGKKQDDGENILVDDDEESDEQFSERMKVYYEKPRDNYIKNDNDLRELYRDDGFTYKYYCEHCDYEATNIKRLKNHIETRHEDTSQIDRLPYYFIDTFDCKKCDYKVRSEKVLKKHVQLAHSDLVWDVYEYKDKLYACHLCDLRLTDQRS